MNNFKVGDVVVTKGGNVKMTVERVSENDITCVWFDQTQIFRRETFSAGMLMLTENGSPLGENNILLG